MSRKRDDKVRTTVQFGDGPEVEIDLDGGSNSRAELKRLADRMSDVLDQMAELQEDKKAIAQAVKSSGFKAKVFNQVLKEKRLGAEYQADQLTLELELDTYREALSLPRTLEAAHKALEDTAAGGGH